MRRVAILLLFALAAAGVAGMHPWARAQVRALIRPEAPPPITPLTVATIAPRATAPVARPTRTGVLHTPPPSILHTPPPSILHTPPPSILHTPPPSATPIPPSATPARTGVSQTPTPAPVLVNGRLYDAYIPAATKEKQDYRYSCEFDAAWVIFATFGQSVAVDDMARVIGVDERVEPYIEETRAGFVIHGGDIASRFSGDYTANFLARSTGAAMRKVFAHYGLRAEPVGDRAGVEAALRRGTLVWMKTTVDFKPWRPAVWRTPEGVEIPTVLGNDHAVVAIGFNREVVVIRDVLGPTSSNWRRPYEYEVRWDTFLAAWGAQGFDGLAVGTGE